MPGEEKPKDIAMNPTGERHRYVQLLYRQWYAAPGHQTFVLSPQPGPRRDRNERIDSTCAFAILALLLVAGWSACDRSKNRRTQNETAAQPEPSATPQTTPTPVQTEFHNVDFHVGFGVVLHIRWLRGELLPTRNDQPPTFDDKDSFMFKVTSGLVVLGPDDLARLMNGYIFADPDAPLRNLEITIKGDRLKEQGTLKKGVGIPFEIEGALSATADGFVKLHATGIKSAHLPVKGLMDLFGLNLARVVNLSKARSIWMQGDDIFLDPARMIPPPRIVGKVSRATVENGGVTLVFGTESAGSSERERPLPLPNATAPNYMYFRGGTLRFGKLTMADSDLDIVDMDPRDPFDFDLGEYQRQLVAGYSKSTARNGLITFMPDLHRLRLTKTTSSGRTRSE